METNTAYILVGVPGAGKSTWINNQTWLKNYVVVSTDAFVEQYALEQKKTYTEVFQQYMPIAIELMIEQVKQAREDSKNIIWDQTSTTVLSRAKKFNMLPDYKHIAITFRTPPLDVLKTRLANRPGKVVPWSVVEGMINNFQSPTEEEGYRELWYVN